MAPTARQIDLRREGGYVYKIDVWSDNLVVVTLYNSQGFEAYTAESRIHPSEKSADTISRLIDRIEDEYKFPGEPQD